MNKRTINRTLAAGAGLMGIVSIALRDADKSPLYFLLAVVLWQLGDIGAASEP